MSDKVLIAGGGSGGHVAPAIAAAEALASNGIDAILAHSSRKTDSQMVEQTIFENIALPATPLSTKPIGFTRFCAGFVRTSRKVRKIIRNNNINCVLATGGFVAAPSLHAARKSSCPTVLLNLDNPPGKANQLAVRWADRILSTVDCNLDNIELIQPPLRQSVINSSSAATCKKKLGLDPNCMTLLVTGASQGASTINALIPTLAKRNLPLFQGWQILHIAGVKNIEQVQLAWNGMNIQHIVLGFHHQMGDVWGAADLAVTRGGANTIAEICINAVPTVVMPYPYHKDEHQRANATPLEHSGGIVIATDHIKLEQNVVEVGSVVLRLMRDHKTRFAMRQAMVGLEQSNGAQDIATCCMDCIKQG